LRQRDRALRAMGYFDGLLKTQPYIAGQAFSMADITVIGAFIFAAIVKLDVPAQFTALHAWHERMQERPSVKAWNGMVEETKAAAWA
jgi:glutathione S-transferase